MTLLTDNTDSLTPLTEVEELTGGILMDEMDDLEYFKQKIYRMEEAGATEEAMRITRHQMELLSETLKIKNENSD